MRPSRVKKALFSSLCIACLLLFEGCWNGRLLIAVEQPWWTAHGGDAFLRGPLTRTSLEHGYLPHLVVIASQGDPRARLQKELAVRRYSAAVVGPLLSLEPQTFAAAHADTRFLLVEDPLEIPALPNATRLLFDRTNAYRTTGIAAGLSIRDQSGGIVTASLASRIGVLVSEHPPGTPQELASFMAGVAGALDGGQPVTRLLRDPIDRNTVRSAIEGMRREGVEIFLLFMGAGDSWSLEVLKNGGGCAVVSDWAASAAFPEQIFLSIEMRIPAGIASFLSFAGREGENVNGPVRVVAGKARRVPTEVAPQVEAR